MNVESLKQLNIEEATFIVLDFETLTPKGAPPEPIEIGAMRICPGLNIDKEFKVDWFIKPPSNVHFTSFDTDQTGIRFQDVNNAMSAKEMFNKLDNIINDIQYIFVAQNARYEASIITRFANECPKSSQMPFVDTVALARFILPGLPNYKLDSLANYFSIEIPYNRHRALPDVKITVQVFLQLIDIGLKSYNLKQINDLIHIAGLKTPSSEKVIQTSLFDI